MVTVNFDPEGEGISSFILSISSQSYGLLTGYICLAFSFLTGIPYTILLCVMLLATLDRYVGNFIYCHSIAIAFSISFIKTSNHLPAVPP